MAGRYLTDLADVCRAAGLTVVEDAGWQTRARGSGGYTGDRPWCVMWHHTASSTSPANDVAYITRGADAAPLANVLVARDGSVWICAAGATNTNGSGGPLSLPSGRTVPVDQMNTTAVGVEIANAGTGEAWPQVQVDAAFTLSLAVAAAYGMRPDDVGVHSVWAPGRKIDPATAAAVRGPWQPRATNASGSWSLDDVRAELNRRAASSPVPKPEPPDPTPTPEDDDMTPFLISNGAQTAIVYGSGIVTGLAGADIAAATAKFGPPITTDPTVFGDFVDKSTRLLAG